MSGQVRGEWAGAMQFDADYGGWNNVKRVVGTETMILAYMICAAISDAGAAS